MTCGVTFWLKNGKVKDYAWDIKPGGRRPTAGRTIGWGRREMRKDGVRGRSTIERIEAYVDYRRGGR